MTEPSESEYAQQEREWKAYARKCEAAGKCPHSGLTFRSCKSFLCDCFDYPEHGVSQK